MSDFLKAVEKVKSKKQYRRVDEFSLEVKDKGEYVKYVYQ